jgi:hypothetical protein
MTSHKFIANKISNLYEMCSSNVHVPSKIISAERIKHMGSVTTGEREINISVVAVNAIVKHVYPMLIFPRVNFKNYILSGALTALIGSANPVYWPNERLFLEYLKQFYTCERPLSNGQLSLKKS